MSYRTCCLSPVDSVPFHIVEYTFIGAMSEMNLCIVSLDQKLQFSVTKLFFFFWKKGCPASLEMVVIDLDNSSFLCMMFSLEFLL